MSVSIIGTGRMGQRIVQLLSTYNHHLKWGSREVEKAAKLIEAFRLANVTAAATEKALDADIIIHTLWFRDLLTWAETHREKLAGKILVDVANPFTDDFSDFTTDWGTSAAEELQKALPDTYVVGAFKNTFFKVFDEPMHQGVASDIFVTSDHEDAKMHVMQLLHPLPFRILDGGSLQNNRTIERMTLFEREVAVRYGNYPYVSLRLFGLENEAYKSLQWGSK